VTLERSPKEWRPAVVAWNREQVNSDQLLQSAQSATERACADRAGRCSRRRASAYGLQPWTADFSRL